MAQFVTKMKQVRSRIRTFAGCGCFGATAASSTQSPIICPAKPTARYTNGQIELMRQMGVLDIFYKACAGQTLSDSEFDKIAAKRLSLSREGVALPNFILQKSATTSGGSSEVRKFQQGLILCGFALPQYGADGRWGNESTTAMNNYQEARGLEKTTRPDAATVARLNSEPSVMGTGLSINYAALSSATGGSAKKVAAATALPTEPVVAPYTAASAMPTSMKSVLVGLGLATVVGLLMVFGEEQARKGRVEREAA